MNRIFTLPEFIVRLADQLGTASRAIQKHDPESASALLAIARKVREIAGEVAVREIERDYARTKGDNDEFNAA